MLYIDISNECESSGRESHKISELVSFLGGQLQFQLHVGMEPNIDILCIWCDLWSICSLFVLVDAGCL